MTSGQPATARALILDLPPWALSLLIALPLALAYLIIAPQSADLAAATYRSYLFSEHGLTLWDNGWYGGHHLPAYSLISPALGALLSPRVAQAIAVVAACVLFAALIRGRYCARATRIACAWFALGAGVELLSGRVPYDIGLALGLGALAAAQRRWRIAALVSAVLCSLASPVAGAFLALGCLAWALGAPSGIPGRLHLRRAYASSASRFIESRERQAAPVGRRFRLFLGVGALLVIAVAALLFPEGGSEPFVASAFYPAEALVAIVAAALPAEQRVLRTGALLYAVALASAFVLPTAVGGNAVRLGALIAGPLAVCGLVGRRDRLLLALAPLFAYWQLVAPIRDFVSANSDPAVHASYYAPLLAELKTLGVGYGSSTTRPTRIEAIPTRDHWEARFLAPRVMIARGWERQLDRSDDSLFYESNLTPQRYRAWLRAQAVSYVALPDAPLDSSGRTEARLVRSASLGYLREVWRSAHWRLFAVTGPSPLAQYPAVLKRVTSDAFTLSTPRAGAFTIRLRFTPYWSLQSSGGCVRRGAEGWTVFDAKRAGSFRVGIDFSLGRVFDHGPRCR